MMTWIVLLGYLAVQLGIGYIVSKRIKSDQDYFLGGRTLGMFAATFSVFATWFGAETCIGSSAAVFEGGLSGSKADPFGYTLCLFFAAFFLASQLWKLKITTLGDFFRLRYTPAVEKTAVLVIIPTSIIWAAAQLQAFSQILSVVTEISVGTALIIATVIVIAYTSLGGLLADVANDIMQGSIVIIGLVTLGIFAVVNVGGIENAIQHITSDPSRLNFRSSEESLLMQMDGWMVPILGSLIAQEMLSRILASRTAKIARVATFAACGVYLMVGIIPIFLGLLGPHFVTGELAEVEQFLPQLARTLLPPAFFVIFAGAIIAAIMSTIDSALLSVSAYVTHNLLHDSYFKLSNKRQVFFARLILIATGGVAYGIAVAGGSVYELVETASSFGSAGVLIVTFGGLWTRKFAGPITAVVTLAAGVVLTPIYTHFEADAPFIFTVLSCLTIYLVLGRIEPQLQAIFGYKYRTAQAATNSR